MACNVPYSKKNSVKLSVLLVLECPVVIRTKVYSKHRLEAFVQFKTRVQGFHVYKDVWNPHIGEHFLYRAATATICLISEILYFFVLFR